MIIKQLRTHFYLDSQQQGQQHRVLSNFKVIVTFSENNQLGVYKVHPDNKVDYFQISSGIGEMTKCDNWEFILSKKENLILCKTEESKNQLVLFTVDISKRSIIDYRRLQVDEFMIWISGCFQSQFYQLYQEKFYIYSYKKFPILTKTIFCSNVRGFMTIYYHGIRFLKLKFTNAPDQYFKLPLRMESPELFRYSLQQKHTLFTIRTRDPIKQQTIGYAMPMTLNICRANDQIIFFMKETKYNVKGGYYKEFITIRDHDKDMRYASMRPKQKIIRKLHEAGGLAARQILNRFMIITQKIQKQIVIVDTATNKKIFLTEAQEVSVCGNSLLSLNKGEGKIYELNYLPLHKINGFQK